jgi:hypothetical protein
MELKYYRPSQVKYNKILGKIAAYRASRRPDGREGSIKDAGEFVYESSREKATRTKATSSASSGREKKIGSTARSSANSARSNAIRKSAQSSASSGREKKIGSTARSSASSGRENRIARTAKSSASSGRENRIGSTARGSASSSREKASRKTGSGRPSKLTTRVRRFKNSSTGKQLTSTFGFGSKFSRAKTRASGKVYMAKKNAKGAAKKWGSAAQKAALEKAQKASAAARKKGNNLSNSRLGRRLGLNKRRVTDR